MAKNKLIKQPEFEDFSALLDGGDEAFENHEAINTMVDNIFQAANQHVQSAIDLTRLIIDKTTTHSTTEEKIFETYRKALQVVVSTSPLEKLMEKLG